MAVRRLNDSRANLPTRDLVPGGEVLLFGPPNFDFSRTALRAW